MITVFSAADYPQFQHDETDRFNNKGAVVMLHPPSFSEYTVSTYAPAPRPQGTCFYDLDVPDSADELPECEAAGSDCEHGSGASSGRGVDSPSDTVPAAITFSCAVHSTANAAGEISPEHGIVSVSMQPNHIQLLGRGKRKRITKSPG